MTKDTIKKQKFLSVQRGSTPWVKNSESKHNKYIKAGEGNLFPQYLIDLYNNSSINAACINAIVENIIGGGLTSNFDFALNKANNRGETWNDIFTKTAIDFYLHGAFSMEVIWSMDRSTIAEVYHIDYSHIRAKEKNYRGEIPAWFISSEWAKKGGLLLSTDENVFEIPSYNPASKQDEPSQIYVSKNYRPGMEYYTLPVYNGALKVIELDKEVDNFHVNNIKNSLAPSLAITTFTNGSDDEVAAVEAMLRANYAGTNNAGSVMYMDVDSPENAPKIEPIPNNGNDGYYETVNEMSMQKILTAHRITSPMMLGIKTPGQLGGRDEVIDAYLLFQNTVIAPLQQDMLKCFENLLQVNFPDIVIGVETKQLYQDGRTEEEITTSVEVTDAEDSNINDETII